MTLQETNPADTSAMLVGQRLSHIATERGGIESETVRAVEDDADTGSIDPPPKGTMDKVSVSGSAVFWLRVLVDVGDNEGVEEGVIDGVVDCVSDSVGEPDDDDDGPTTAMILTRFL